MNLNHTPHLDGVDLRLLNLLQHDASLSNQALPWARRVRRHSHGYGVVGRRMQATAKAGRGKMRAIHAKGRHAAAFGCNPGDRPQSADATFGSGTSTAASNAVFL